MRVLLTGGTGFLGAALRDHLEVCGHSVTVVSRNPDKRLRYVDWEHLPEPDDIDAVVNLAGESVADRWSTGKRERIVQSRVLATRRVVEWMRQMPAKSKVLLSGSAVGIYGDMPGDRFADEATPIDPHDGFRSEVCSAWEAEARAAESDGHRVVLLRIGNVLHPSGGYLNAMRRKLAASPFIPVLGDADGPVPWVSLADAVDLIRYALEAPDLTGPLNIVAPGKATQRDLARLVALMLGRPNFGRIPRSLLRLVLGEFSRAITDRQRVLPTKALEHGYGFIQPNFDPERLLEKG